MTLYRTIDPAIVDYPLLQASDYDPDNITFYYFAGNKSDLYYRNSNGISKVASSLFPEARGVLAQPLLPSRCPYQTDYDGEIIVKVIFGKPMFVDEAAFRAGSNQMLVGAFGRWELIWYKNVKKLDTNLYSFTTLLRGRKGSDSVIDQHQPGDAVLFDLSIAQKFTRPSVEIGTGGVTSVVPAGASPSLPTGLGGPLGIDGSSLRCLPPADLRGALDASAGNLAITWKRRDRAAGAWFAPIPLTEPDVYTVDLYAINGVNAVLIKSYPAIAGQALMVPVADLTTASAAGRDIYGVAVTQDNSVGRGWPKIGILHVR